MNENKETKLEDIIEEVETVAKVELKYPFQEQPLQNGISFERTYVAVESPIVINKVEPVSIYEAPAVVKEPEVVKPVNVEPEKIVEVQPNQMNLSLIKKKVSSIRVGRLVTVIHGNIDTQKVLHGRVVSIIDDGVTILEQEENVKDPKVIHFDSIIDIFEVKKFKKDKESFSIFKMNKKIKEFFSGDEEELRHAYEQKITVKKLRDELKKKDKK